MNGGVDPSKTPAYNHFPIDGEKPVISNLQFKAALESNDKVFISHIIAIYALDQTQKNLLTDKLELLK